MQDCLGIVDHGGMNDGKGRLKLPLRTVVSLLRPSVRRQLRQFDAALDAAHREVTSNEFTPDGVPRMDERAKALLEAAWGLAGDDEWADDAAVTELRRLAGHHHDALRVAEINSRHGGRFLDLPIENRAQRLLEAAYTGHLVSPVSDEERSRMELIDAFDSLDPEDQWRELTRQVTGLEDLEAEAVALRGCGPPFSDRRAWARWAVEQDQIVKQKVRGLVGPGSGSADTVLASIYAREFTTNYLIGRRFRPGDPSSEGDGTDR
jgi:hypothetical protein